MKTTKIPGSKSPRNLTKRHGALSIVRHFAAVSVATLLMWAAPEIALAQGIVYSVNIVGCVPDLTINLLTAPLTMAQRQVLHAQNFQKLAPGQRTVYLHAVAYSVGYSVASGGKLPSAAMLTQHLTTVASICDAPAIPAGCAAAVNAGLACVSGTMQQLNTLIAGPVANNVVYPQSMCAGAVNSFMDFSDWWW